MMPFVFAAGAVYAALFIATLFAEHDAFFGPFAPGQPLLSAAFAVLIAPTIATWLAAELLGLIRPPRLLDARVHRPAARLATGFGAGVLGVIAGTLSLIFLDRALPDAVLMSAAAAASASAVLLVQARQRPFACPGCAYDLSGASPASGGKCPECGYDFFGPALPALAWRLGPCDDAMLTASPPPSAASPPASSLRPECP